MKSDYWYRKLLKCDARQQALATYRFEQWQKYLKAGE